jgi:hypothetical protein
VAVVANSVDYVEVVPLNHNFHVENLLEKVDFVMVVRQNLVFYLD